jgi:hypothetical protein
VNFKAIEARGAILSRVTDDNETVELLRIYVTPSQLGLLKKLNLPGAQEVLSSATVTDPGIQLSGLRKEFEALVSGVTGEAKRQADGASVRTELLGDLADRIHAALSRRLRT